MACDVTFGLENRGVAVEAIEDRIDRYATELDATALIDRRIETLSRGETVTVALLGILVTEPDAVVLDDPLASLVDDLGVEIRNVHRAYDGIAVLDGISLSVDDGETVAVMGSNGAGKTTFLKLLAGLDDRDDGSVDVDGVVGFAPEDPEVALFAETVAEVVAFFPRERGLDAESHAERAMEAMDVSRFRERYPRSLSAGEQRRVAIASVLSGDPAVMALDEPTAGQGRTGERQLGSLLAGLDTTVVFSTHEGDFAYEFADRVAVLDGGVLRRVGTPGDVLMDESILQAAGIRQPGLIQWARRQGFDRLPVDFEDAVEEARERR